MSAKTSKTPASAATANPTPEPAGYIDTPLPRRVLYVALTVYVVWLGFLGAMVWVRMTDPHYLGP